MLAILTPKQRLVRFVAEDGAIYYGDAGTSEDGSFPSARVIEGNIFGEYSITDDVKVPWHESDELD